MSKKLKETSKSLKIEVYMIYLNSLGPNSMLIVIFSVNICGISFNFSIKPILPGFYHVFISVFNRLNPGGFYWAGLFSPSLVSITVMITRTLFLLSVGI